MAERSVRMSMMQQLVLLTLLLLCVAIEFAAATQLTDATIVQAVVDCLAEDASGN